MQTEIEHLSRFVTAYTFYMAEQSLKTETESLKEMDDALTTHKKTVREAETDADNLKQNVEIVKGKREAVGSAHKTVADAVCTMLVPVAALRVICPPLTYRSVAPHRAINRRRCVRCAGDGIGAEGS